MRFQAQIFAVVLCSCAVAACGSDGNGSTGGTGGTGGSGGSGGGDQTSTAAGTVYDFLSDEVIPGATVSVYGNGTNISDTTDQNGDFSLPNVPNGATFFVAEAAGYWGTVDYYDVPDETSGGFPLFLVSDGDIDTLAGELGRTISAEDGIVDIYFYTGAVNGASGTINPPNHDAPFTFDENDSIQIQDTIIAIDDGQGDSYGDLYFTGVPADTTVTANVTGPSGTTCQVNEEAGTKYAGKS